MSQKINFTYDNFDKIRFIINYLNDIIEINFSPNGN